MSGNGASPRARRFDALKFRATLAALPLPRYRRAVEIGCSIGELTRQLRERADDVLGLDVSSVAIDEARRVHGSAAGLHLASTSPRREAAESERQ